jgi:eukaryotic-like serine/threonine-protein kinase
MGATTRSRSSEVVSSEGCLQYDSSVTTGPRAGETYDVGTVLDGKYVVERVLGRGATGVVLLARHLELGERRALKLLHPWLNEPGRVDRFKLEARAAVKLKSDHVARIFDVGTLPGGVPYIVMESLEGCDLADYLAARGRLDIAEAIGLARQACDGIDEAHRLGIVHRDLKPANLFVHRRPDGRTVLKVLDFGVAKVRISPTTISATREGAIVGTPRYMSPEQARSSQSVDPRADIWALGAILYELVTGKPAFDARSLGELTSKILLEAPRPPRELRPDLPSAVAATILRCLEKDPERRFDSARDLSTALAPDLPVRDASGGTEAPGSVARTGRGTVQRGGRAGPAALAMAGALAGAILGTSISVLEARERRSARERVYWTLPILSGPVSTESAPALADTPPALAPAMSTPAREPAAKVPGAAPKPQVTPPPASLTPTTRMRPPDAFGDNRR